VIYLVEIKLKYLATKLLIVETELRPEGLPLLNTSLAIRKIKKPLLEFYGFENFM